MGMSDASLLRTNTTISLFAELIEIRDHSRSINDDRLKLKMIVRELAIMEAEISSIGDYRSIARDATRLEKEYLATSMLSFYGIYCRVFFLPKIRRIRDLVEDLYQWAIALQNEGKPGIPFEDAVRQLT